MRSRLTVLRGTVAIGLVLLIAWALISYWQSGFVYLLVAGDPDSTSALSEVEGPWLQRLRDAIAAWGPLAPLVYVLLVIAEVIVAPFPGTILYAPAGAIFGGLLGGTLSLIGNVIGAAIACAIGNTIGERTLGGIGDSARLHRYRDRLRDRGMWVVMVLRLNPLTTSDLVSYAAGLAGVPPWKVAAGTLIGLAPMCYVQAYFAQQLFDLLPGRVLILGGLGLAVVLVLMMFLGNRRS